MSAHQDAAWDVAHALGEAGKTLGRMEARILLQHATGMTAAEIASHPERNLRGNELEHFLALVKRRAAGEPVAYLTGVREFYGRKFIVTPEVLIPRPETELLVELGLEKLSGIPTPRILDLGCGSACIAVSLSLELPAASVTAVDHSAAALAVARRNAAALGAKLLCIESDWYAALDNQRYHLIVANPPYIAARDPHLVAGDLRFEPLAALASGDDGLTALGTIIEEAPRHLLPGGWLLFEHGYDQAAPVRDLLKSAGFVDIEQHRDLAGIIRVSGGSLPRDDAA